jgi:hypothetical protein
VLLGAYGVDILLFENASPPTRPLLDQDRASCTLPHRLVDIVEVLSVELTVNRAPDLVLVLVLASGLAYPLLAWDFWTLLDVRPIEAQA